MNDVIGRYARLSVAAERMQRAGRQVPLEIVREIQQIEAVARARMSPSQIAAAMQHVNHARNEILQKEISEKQATVVENHRNATDRMSRSLTKNWFNRPEGLSQEQFVAVRDGKNVKFPAQKRLTPEQLDRLSIEQTRAIDPKGKGFKFKEWEEKLDELADTDPLKFQEAAKQYRADPNELREAAKRWRTERIEVGLQRRREEREGVPKDVDVDSSSHQRKAAIVDAFAKSYNPKDKHHQALFDESDGGDRIIAEGAGMEGSAKRSADVARAWDEVESQGGSDEQVE